MPKPKSLAFKLIAKEKREKTGFLDLGNCGLTELPEELGELVWLEELILGQAYYSIRRSNWVRSNNKGKLNFIAALPDWLRRLERLRTLYFGGLWENIVWAIDDLSPLASLSQLQSLHFSGTRIADLLPLAGLNQLQSLHCSKTQIADLSPLAGLSQLQALYCFETPITDLSPLADLSQLQTLSFSDTQIYQDLRKRNSKSGMQMKYN
jgi:internalin A